METTKSEQLPQERKVLDSSKTMKEEGQWGNKEKEKEVEGKGSQLMINRLPPKQNASLPRNSLHMWMDIFTVLIYSNT